MGMGHETFVGRLPIRLPICSDVRRAHRGEDDKSPLRRSSVFQRVAGDFRGCGGLLIRLRDAQPASPWYVRASPARCDRRIANPPQVNNLPHKPGSHCVSPSSVMHPWLPAQRIWEDWRHVKQVVWGTSCHLVHLVQPPLQLGIEFAIMSTRIIVLFLPDRSPSFYRRPISQQFFRGANVR